MNLSILLLTVVSSLFVVVTAAETESKKARITFVNFLYEPVKLSWIEEEEDGKEYHVGTVEPLGEIMQDTEIGHSFTLKSVNGDNDEVVSVDDENQVHVIGPKKFNVACTTTEGNVRITVRPDWSPMGAVRFLDLIMMKYYDGCALNRVVKGFLTQFGIGADYESRTRLRELNIFDDIKNEDALPFQPGYMSYAGSGPDSRTTEVFIVMPDTPQEQLEAFGAENSWETPFGYVDTKDLEMVVSRFYSDYGDMTPMGNGPDPQKIYMEDGYKYLRNDFPNLSYINECHIVSPKYVPPNVDDTTAKEL